VEALFAELKNQIGLRRLRLRRMKFAREQFFLAAAAQNIKRLVRFITQPATPALGSKPLNGRQTELAAITLTRQTITPDHRVFQHPRLVTTVRGKPR